MKLSGSEVKTVLLLVEDAEAALGELEREINDQRLDLDKLRVRVKLFEEDDLGDDEKYALRNLPSTVDELEEQRNRLKVRVDDLRTASWNR